MYKNVTKKQKATGHMNFDVQYVFNIVVADLKTLRVLKNFPEFAGKQQDRSLFFNKVTSLQKWRL